MPVFEGPKYTHCTSSETTVSTMSEESGRILETIVVRIRRQVDTKRLVEEEEEFEAIVSRIGVRVRLMLDTIAACLDCRVGEEQILVYWRRAPAACKRIEGLVERRRGVTPPMMRS